MGGGQHDVDERAGRIGLGWRGRRRGRRSTARNRARRTWKTGRRLRKRAAGRQGYKAQRTRQGDRRRRRWADERDPRRGRASSSGWPSSAGPTRMPACDRIWSACTPWVSWGRFNGLRVKAVKEKGGDIPGMPNVAKLSMSQIVRLTRDLGLQIARPAGTLHAYRTTRRPTWPGSSGILLSGVSGDGPFCSGSLYLWGH